MRILHYYLGWHRQGGMNRYAVDLAQIQVRSGHTVFGLYPAGRLFRSAHPSIRSSRLHQGIPHFELSGGVPIPLLEGIRDPQMILGAGKRLPHDEVCRFCDLLNIDLLHIHTWMGFPVELLDELQLRKVKIIFTAHDYFGICPKVNFINQCGQLCSGPENTSCTVCNSSAPAESYLQIRNITWLMSLRKVLNPGLRLFSRIRHAVPPPVCSCDKDYMRLLQYYRDLFLRCDKIHFNSRITEGIFRRFIPEIRGKVLPISHCGIIDRRKIRQRKPGKLRLFMLGGESPYKGFPVLREVLDSLRRENLTNWELNVWGTSRTGGAADIRFCGNFRSSCEEKILEDADLVIVPSICYETFGFIIPEALSMGIPVLCSDTVGAQMLVEPEMVYHGTDGLRTRLNQILTCPEILNEVNQRICRTGLVPTMEEHVRAMECFYEE